jgi:transcriptional regulator GlxA family with amidase domain
MTDRTVVHVAYPGIALLDLVGPAEVFAVANQMADSGPRYRSLVASADGRPITGNSGLRLDVDARLSSVAGRIDTLLISAGLTYVEAMRSDELVSQVRRIAGGARRVGSTCVGAFVLAAAGLLDGRPATTHWMHAEALRRLHPAVRLDPGVLFVDDGDVLTSAGNAAGIDLLLHLVRRDHGSEVANRVARRNVVAPWREGGQAQFVERPLPEVGDVGTAATRAWAVERLGEPLTLADLAAHARMSVRTFTRRFRDETGLSPLRWLAGQRLALARQLLESTDAPIDRVAADAGFGTPASLRQHLRATIGVAPGTYRRSYRGGGVTGHSPV